MVFPSEQAQIHHVSMLKKCINDPGYVFPIEGLGVQENLSYKDAPIKIFVREV